MPVERVAASSCGISLRRRLASLTHSSIEAGELAMVRDFRPAGRVMPYSAPSMPPQDWPTHMDSPLRKPEMVDQVVQLVDKQLRRPEIRSFSGRRVDFPQPSWS